MSEERKPLFPVSVEVVVFALVALAAPVIGGQVTTSATPITSGLLAELLGGPALPLTTRLVLGLPLLLLLGLVLYRRRVLQLPNFPIVGGWAVACGFLFVSGCVSRFPQSALNQWWSWPLYVVALVTVVAVAGRKDGVVWILSGLAGGVTVVALKGILEYRQHSATDASWRIFADWNNPNALATVLVMGLPVILALAARGPHLTMALWSLAGGLAMAAVWYTGSKGGLLALMLALAIFGAFSLASKTWLRAGAVVAASVAVAALVFFALRPPLKVAAQTKAEAAAPRVLAASQQSEQSVDFRKNLWKSAVVLIKAHPMGLGTGNFRYYSGQPGIIEQTVFAHQTWLQLAVDGSVLCLVGALVGMGAWLWPMLKRDGALPAQGALLKAGVLAAVVAGAAHGCVESNLYTFGAGLTFFVLLGCGCQLSATGSAPYPVGMQTKAIGAVAALGVLLGLTTSSMTEMAKANAVDGLKSGQADQVTAASQALEASAPDDAEALYLRGMYAAHSPEDRIKLLSSSADRAPITKTLRALATTQSREKMPNEAMATLDRALELDPFNLRTLAAKMRIERENGHDDRALVTARRLVEVETRPLFTTRAIPEVIPTETYEARVFLAERETDAKAKVALLIPAVQGYVHYAQVTYPRVKQMAGANGQFVDISLDEAKEVLKTGVAAAQKLKEAAQLAGDSGALETSTGALAALSLE